MLIRRHRRSENAENEQRNEERPQVEAKQEKALKDHTVPELKELAKKRDIEGYASMTKGELIEVLSNDN